MITLQRQETNNSEMITFLNSKHNGHLIQTDKVQVIQLTELDELKLEIYLE